MNDFLYKHVLFKDLHDYLKRTDYLDGYTPTEKALIRKNLGILGLKEIKEALEKQVAGVKVLNYENILELVNTSTLIPGFIYIIDDFLTIYLFLEKNGRYVTYGLDINPSKVYKLITIACTENLLLSSVSILSDDLDSIYWEAKYDITLETLNDGTTTKGKIVYLKDNNDNKALFDFKNIIGLNGYTFQSFTGKENSNNCKGNDLTGSSNVFLTGDCSYNVIRGCNIYFKLPISNFIGKLNNVTINTNLFNNETIKTSVLINNIYNIDYLDQETLTHLFYKIQ